MGLSTYTMATKGTSKEHRLRVKLQIVRYSQEHGIKPAVRKFGVDRNTAKKWLRRYLESGINGLLDRRKGPKVIKHKTSATVEMQVIAIKKRVPAYGAKRIKYFYDIPCSRGAIQRIIKKHRLTKKRRKKYQTKRDLREVKALYQSLTHLQMDIKYLRDIPTYWAQMKTLGLPKFEYTIRDTKSGWVFLGYSDELSELNARTMVTYVILSLKQALPISSEDIWVQTDNGSEFSGRGKTLKTASFVRAVVEGLGVNHNFIPPGCCNANADVESFHNTIEEEFFDLAHFESRKCFFRSVETYRLWYNLKRPNFSKKGLTPLEIIEGEHPNEIGHSKLTCISTVDLDKISYISPESRGESLPCLPGPG